MSRGPLHGLSVLDFGHTVMGPSCGMILADLGADVLKIEPSPGGDPTRRLKGFGTGYFGYFNRNKRSLAVDLKSPEGNEIALDLVARADVLIENFGPGTMDRLGLSYDVLARHNPRLIYASLKGFFDGPYGERLALDEIVQMMSGLAFMTGPRGKPLRAGTSVIDIAGAMFGVIAIQAALRVRDETGQGQRIGSALYESAVFLMGQHLCYAAQSDEPVPPMPNRVSAWAVYETFAVAGGAQLFIGITSDAHWQRFCEVAGLTALAQDATLATNNARIEQRPRLIPLLAEYFSGLRLEEAVSVCLRSRIPFAEVRQPEDLFDDPHLMATDGLIPVTLPNGTQVGLPRLPIAMEGLRGDADDPPQMGEHSREVLRHLGLDEARIDELIARGIVAAAQAPAESLGAQHLRA
ncbi:CaiB/BaiF CoA transferase family protein [Microvirga sp. 2TAF3]|uniref:CaiB/BaiF CoA transferase family protein n=1 Tax=Microvirga sp. 2TAF3 TaxID=3233014 RepID=UPI003F9EB85B